MSDDAARPEEPTARLSGPAGPASGEPAAGGPADSGPAGGGPAGGGPVAGGPAADRTRPIPAVPDQPAPRWAGRAAVAPGQRRALDSAEDWPVPDEGPNRAWWLPIVAGIAALLLVGLILLGVWLAQRRPNGPVVPPAPSAAASAPPPSPAPSPSPSLSPSPSPSPSPSTGTVLLPPLRGLTLSDAEQTLASLGLTYTVQSQVDDSLPAGTVSGTQPAENTLVPIGSQVVILVAQPALSSGPPSPSPEST